MLRWTPRWEHWFRRLLPAYWVFLFLCTHLPRPERLGPVRSDKTAHVLAFAVLALAYWKFVESFRRPLPDNFVWWAAMVLFAYAAVDEYLQGFVGRGPDVADWLADVAGVAAVLIVLELRRRSSRQELVI